MAKLTKVLVALATIYIGGAGAKSIPSFASCQRNILNALDNIHSTTATIQQHLDNSERTRRDADTFARPKTCQVSKTVLTSMYNELNATLNEAEPEAQGSVCTTPGGESSSDSSSCKSILKLIQCSVSHLKAAYANSATSVATIEQQEKWEKVVEALKRETSKAIGSFKETREQINLELDALSSKLNDVTATLSCMEDVIRAKIEDTVVDKILLEETEDAGSWFQQLKVDAKLLEAIVSQAFNRMASNDAAPKRVENAAKILDFLGTLTYNPQLGIQGATHLLGEMKAAGDWPNAYVEFKAALNMLKASKGLSRAAQRQINSLQESLDEALDSHISANADLIIAGNPTTAADFFVNKIGFERNAFKAIIADAYSRNKNVDNIISFLEKLNNKSYSVDGLKALYSAMKSNNNQIATAEIFKLNAHYKSMHLSDESLLKNIQEAMGQVYDKWAANVRDKCDQLRSTASQHGGNFNAFEVIRRGFNGVPSRAGKVADCVEKLPWILHGIEGYGGLLKKLDELDHIDTYEYMGIVQRFKEYAESKRNQDHYPADIVKNTRNVIPSNVRDFFFSSGSCSIVSKTEQKCIAVKGDPYYGTIFFTDYRYDTYLSSGIGNGDCKVSFRKRSGHVAEYQIVSEKTNTLFYVSGGQKCGSDCGHTHFWGDNAGDEANSWFKIKPYGRGSKFAIMNTFYPGVLYASGDWAFSAVKDNVDVTVDAPRDFWTVSC